MLQLRTRSSSPFENWSCFRQFNSVWRVFHAITKLFPLGKIENCTNRRFERSMLLKFDNFKKDCRFLTQIYKWKPYMVLSKHFSKKFLGLFDKTRIKSLKFLQSKQFTSPKTSNKLIETHNSHRNSSQNQFFKQTEVISQTAKISLLIQ